MFYMFREENVDLDVQVKLSEPLCDRLVSIV